MSKNEPIVVLEGQINRLLLLVRRLKEDNAGLNQRVKSIDSQLSKKMSEANAWTRDRARVETKVRRILAELDNLSQTQYKGQGSHEKTH